MFYLVIVPTLAFFLFQIYTLLSWKKHDDHLYVFCELRRDALRYLFENWKDLSKDEYKALRKLLWVLNFAIENYKSQKTAIFNIRNIYNHVAQLKRSSKKQDRIQTENSDIKELIRRGDRAIFSAFLAYTPFFKSEIILNLCYFIFRAAANAGLKQVNSHLAKLKEAESFVEKRSNLARDR